MMSRYRIRIIGATLVLCAATAIAWRAYSSRHHAVAAHADRLVARGVILQRTSPWRVEQINLWPSDLPAEEARLLRSFRDVKLLNLQGGTITDAELSYLTELPHLETLILGETQITDQGLQTIARIASLKKVSLEHAKVTNVAVRLLKQRRPDLHIEVYEVSLVGLGHLKPYLPHATLDEDYELRSLDLLASEVADEDLRPLARCERLRMLNLSETSIGDDGVAHLASLVRLEELWLRRTKVTDHSLAVIGQLQHLRALSLAETSVSDTGIEQLRGLPRLEILHLGNTQVSDIGLKALGGLSSLKELYLTNSLVTDEGVAGLMAVLPDTKVVADPAASDRAEDIESQVLG